MGWIRQNSLEETLRLLSVSILRKSPPPPPLWSRMSSEIQVRPSTPHVVLTSTHVAALFRVAALQADETVYVVNPANGKSIIVQAFQSKFDEFASRVELTGTALRRIGLEAPTRATNNLAGTAPCRLIGPAGQVDLSEGTFRVWRYVDMNPAQAASYKVRHGDTVALRVTSPRNSVTFCTMDVCITHHERGNVITCHLDEDEAGACMLPDAISFDLFADLCESGGLMRLRHLQQTYTGGVRPQRFATARREAENREFKQEYPHGTPYVHVDEESLPGGIELRDEDGFTMNVDVSNRHVHLSASDLKRLFGEGYRLQLHKAIAYVPEMLAKMTGFSAKETLTLRNVETNQEIRHVRILGPVRDRTQIELAHTDCKVLGIEPPSRISGDNLNSSPLLLIAEDLDGRLTPSAARVETGAIRAWRHAHVDEAEGERLGLCHADLVTCAVQTKSGTTLFHDVSVRIGTEGVFAKKEGPPSLVDRAKPYLMSIAAVFLNTFMPRPKCIVHLDTDEGNACLLKDAEHLALYKQLSDGTLKRLGSTKANVSLSTARQAMWENELSRVTHNRHLLRSKLVDGVVYRSRL